MLVEGSCGAEDLANALLTSLTAGKTFVVPEVDLTTGHFQIPPTPPGTGTPEPLTNDDLTTKQPDGTGTFDVIMSSMMAHLKTEFEKNRITGEQYTKAYIALTESSLGNAVQFLLQKDASYWNSVTAQLGAQVAQTKVVQARIELEIAKQQLRALRYEADIAEANYGLIKMKISTESIQYCTGKFQLDNILPEQKLLLLAQRKAAEEQIEVQHAQTSDTKLDGITPVAGVIGKQRELYGQQITSYKRDAEMKVAKIFSDAWITMKTIDEGLLPPTNFANANLDEILTTLKNNVALDPTP